MSLRSKRPGNEAPCGGMCDDARELREDDDRRRPRPPARNPVGEVRRAV